ncbi:MAG: ferrous iron transporter B [Halobacteriovoraceae bacterium]|nr:ferrous iron transporter B [Halobacteriovoraceae bacterium]
MLEKATVKGSNETLLVALAGGPNCGKTALFNALTGQKQRVGNFPGITVEKKIGQVETNGESFSLIDLPGTYSLAARSLDEQVTADILVGRDKNVRQPDLIIAVADATNLEKSLYFVLELIKIGRPVILALNLYDLAQKRGLELDLDILKKELGITVVPTVAVDKIGTKKLVDEVLKHAEITDPKSPINTKIISDVSNMSFIAENYRYLNSLLAKATIKKIVPDTLTQKVDRFVLNPICGPIIMLSTLALIFQAVFEWAGPLQDFVESQFELLSEYVSNIIPVGLLTSFIIDGIIAGVGGFVVFVPQIAILFAFILTLEEIGYMGRIAYLLDGTMRKLGLPGKAVVPLLSSHACAVPGIMAARTLTNEKDRLATMLVAPLTQCSARLPVYTMLIAAIVPDNNVLGPFKLPGLIMFGLYFTGMMFSFLVAFILKSKVIKGVPSQLLMELPDYRLPRLANISKGIWQKCSIFIRKAGTVILVLSIVIWGLVTFPNYNEKDATKMVETSYAASIGRFFEPITRPLGFDWKLNTALIPAFGAREVVVSAMATTFSVAESEDSEAFEMSLAQKMAQNYSLATLVALIVWFIFAPQCVSTIAILKRETGGWKWTSLMLSYTTVMAYVFSFIAYQVISALA